MSNGNRDDFIPRVKLILYKRVCGICSNPSCNKMTTFPDSEDGAINIGIASHICAAAPGGPRYDSTMSKDERTSQNNGIWLCSNCAKKIDSDERFYTVEVLKEWKENAEKNALFYNSNSVFETTSFGKMHNNISITNILCMPSNKECNEDFEDVYSISRENIEILSSLNDYLYCKCISNGYKEILNKDYTFNDNNLKFYKKMLDWIVGDSKFPLKEMKKFSENNDFNLFKVDEYILKKRRNAMIEFFSGNLESAKNVYDDILELAKERKLEEWFEDDILIDGRNIIYRLEKKNNVRMENIYQKNIKERKHIITYPSIDRNKSLLYDNASKYLFDYRNRMKNTRFYGIGLQGVFNIVQQMVYIAVSTGSITQLLLIRDTLSDVMAMYADCYDEELFYKISLREKVLCGNFKDFMKMYKKMDLCCKFINSPNFIDEILKCEQIILPYNKEEFDIFIFDTYGRYIEDDLFMKYEKKILKMLNKKNKRLARDVLSSIPSNIDRFNNKEKLFNILYKMVCSNFESYRYEVEPILNSIDFKTLSSNEKKIFLNVVDIFADNGKELRIMVEIKKSESKNTKYDSMLENPNSILNLMYNISQKSITSSLEYMLSDIEKRMKKREDKPYEFSSYAYQYKIDDSFFKGNRYNRIKSIVYDRIIPLTESILSSKNQIVDEKIRMLKTLECIYIRDNDARNKIKEILKNIEMVCPDKFDCNTKTMNDLSNHILFFEYLFGNRSLSELLSNYSYDVHKNDNDLIEIGNIITTANKFKKIKDKNNLEKLFDLYLIGMKSDDLDIRSSSINMMPLFYNSNLFIVIEEDLLKNVNFLSYDECMVLANMIYLQPLSKRDKYSQLINKLFNSDNYNIRYIMKKYFRNDNDKID